MAIILRSYHNLCELFQLFQWFRHGDSYKSPLKCTLYFTLARPPSSMNRTAAARWHSLTTRMARKECWPNWSDITTSFGKIRGSYWENTGDNHGEDIVYIYICDIQLYTIIYIHILWYIYIYMIYNYIYIYIWSDADAEMIWNSLNMPWLCPELVALSDLWRVKYQTRPTYPQISQGSLPGAPLAGYTGYWQNGKFHGKGTWPCHENKQHHR